MRAGLLAGALLVPALLAPQPTRAHDAKAKAGDTKPATAAVNSDWPFDAKEAIRRQEAAAKGLGVPKEVEIALSDKVTIKFILIPAGKFVMGGKKYLSENPPHKVTISKSFYLGIYEVTCGQYEAIMGNNPARIKGPNMPVDTTTVQNEEGFCRKASQKTGRTVRLPTSEEWEYACRAGTATRFFFGDNPKKLYDYDWVDQPDADKQAHPVGQKKPNPWGLYDMYGNVFERVSDAASRTGYTWRSSCALGWITMISSDEVCGEKGALLQCGFRAAMDVK
jgi:formylglycine-generating enzyme required for sulfatase activity